MNAIIQTETNTKHDVFSLFKLRATKFEIELINDIFCYYFVVLNF
jgi:hypothetical protein